MELEEGSSPLYLQLKKIILDEIKSLNSDARIFSEREYALKYNVSRITVRRCIDELVKENYLIRIVGKGTYVTGFDKSSEFTKVTSFSNEMSKRGYYNTYSKIIEFRVIDSEGKVSEKLKISKSEKVYRLKRIRVADNVPMAIQDSYIIYDSCPTLQEYDFKKESLYRVFRDEFKLEISYAINNLTARLASTEELNIFEQKKTIPVFVLDQVTYLKNGKPIEYVESIYRSDKYIFHNMAL